VLGLAGRDGGCDQHLLDPVQLVQLTVQDGDARWALRHGQGVVRHALDLAHDEAEHPIWEQHGQQGQRVASVFGYVPGPGRRLGTGKDYTETLAHAHTPHLRREPANVTSNARLDLLRRGRGAPERVKLSDGRRDALADAGKVMPIGSDRDRLKLRPRRQPIQPSLAGGQNGLLGMLAFARSAWVQKRGASCIFAAISNGFLNDPHPTPTHAKPY
jgi:hypothetical protein